MAALMLFSNNAQTSIAAAISPADTQIQLLVGTGGMFETPSAGQYQIITLVDKQTGSLNEVMWMTDRVGDTLTVERAKEGTVAQSWSVGDLCNNFCTEGTMRQLIQPDQSQKGFYNIANAGGTVNDLTAYLPSNLSDIPDGMGITVISTGQNTGPATLRLVLGTTVCPTHPIVTGSNVPMIGGEIGDVGYPISLNFSRAYQAWVMANSATKSIPSGMMRWEGKTQDRFPYVIYRNTTGYPVQVLIIVDGPVTTGVNPYPNATFVVDDAGDGNFLAISSTYSTDHGWSNSLYGLVPPNSQYYIAGDPVTDIYFLAWCELITYPAPGGGMVSAGQGLQLIGSEISMLDVGAAGIFGDSASSMVFETNSMGQVISVNPVLSSISHTQINDAIPNSSLVFDSVTINGQSVALGGAITVTSAATAALTIAPALTGGAYDGSVPVAIDIAPTGVAAGAYGDPATVPAYSVNAQGQITTAAATPISIAPAQINAAIPNTGLQNSSVTINGQNVALGGAITVGAATASALTFGVGMVAGAFDGSVARTVELSNTGVAAGAYGDPATVPTYSVNAQGQITTAAAAPISIAPAQINAPIPNASLQNSSMTINGQNIALGGAITVTAASAAALTIDGSLAGGVYDGSAPVTIGMPDVIAGGQSGAADLALIATVDSKGRVTAMATTPISIAPAQINAAIPNTSLQNSSMTINGQSVALGGAITVTAASAAALTFGAGMVAGTFDGSVARTVELTNTGVAAGAYGAADLALTATVDSNGRVTAMATTPISIAPAQINAPIPNTGLQNSSVTINGQNVALGGTYARPVMRWASYPARVINTVYSNSTSETIDISAYVAGPAVGAIAHLTLEVDFLQDGVFVPLSVCFSDQYDLSMSLYGRVPSGCDYKISSVAGQVVTAWRELRPV